MADTKLSALAELAVTPAADDEVYIRDVSEAAADESKRITIASLLSGGSYTIMVAASNATAREKVSAVASGGTVCTGAADEVDIEAAIAIIAALGGVVQLSSGTFTLSDNAEVDIDDDNIWIRGMGPATIVVQLDLDVDPGAWGIFEVTGDGDTISDLFVQGNNVDGANPGTFSYDNIALVGATNCVIRNIWGAGSRSVISVGGGSAYVNISNIIGYDCEHVIQTLGASHVNIDTVIAYNKDTVSPKWIQRGITIHNDSQHISVNNVYVDAPDECGISVISTGAATMHTMDVNISNLHVWHNDDAVHDPTLGILIQSTDDTFGVYNVNISNVTLDDMDFGIRMSSTTAGFVDQVTISKVSTNGTVGEFIDIVNCGVVILITDCIGNTTGGYDTVYIVGSTVKIIGGSYTGANAAHAAIYLEDADDSQLLGVTMDSAGNDLEVLNSDDLTVTDCWFVNGTLDNTASTFLFLQQNRNYQTSMTEGPVIRHAAKIKPNITRIVLPGWFYDTVSTQAMTAGRIYYIPIYVMEDTTYTEVSIHVTTQSVGNADLRVYEWDDGVPGALIADWGSVDHNVLGKRTIAAINWAATGGTYYFLAVRCDATPTLYGIEPASSISPPVDSVNGSHGINGQIIMYVTAAWADPAPAPTAAARTDFAVMLLKEN